MYIDFTKEFIIRNLERDLNEMIMKEQSVEYLINKSYPKVIWTNHKLYGNYNDQ